MVVPVGFSRFSRVRIPKLNCLFCRLKTGPRHMVRKNQAGCELIVSVPNDIRLCAAQAGRKEPDAIAVTVGWAIHIHQGGEERTDEDMRAAPYEFRR